MDAKDESAARFYERYVVRRFADPLMRLYIMMATLSHARARNQEPQRR